MKKNAWTKCMPKEEWPWEAPVFTKETMDRNLAEAELDRKRKKAVKAELRRSFIQFTTDSLGEPLVQGDMVSFYSDTTGKVTNYIVDMISNGHFVAIGIPHIRISALRRRKGILKKL
jgi:hypothetical protein